MILDASVHRVALLLRHCARKAALLPFALLVIQIFCATAASAEVAVDLRVGFGQSATNVSRYRMGSWTPCTVYLTGQGARGVAQLVMTVHLSGKATSYTRNVSLHDGPLNEAVGFVCDLRVASTNAFSGNLTPDIVVQLVLDGRELARKRFTLPLPLNDETFNVLALTRDGSGMNFLTKKRLGLVHRGFNPARLANKFGNPNGAVGGSGYSAVQEFATSSVFYDDPRALPSMAQGYAMIDAVALADQPLDNLTEDQVSALQSYVREGGLLIISGGADLPRLKSQFYQEMLPIQPETSIAASSNTPELRALVDRYHQSLELRGSAALSVGRLRNDAFVVFGPRNGVTGYGLVAGRPYGSGFVLFTAFDFIAPEFRSWRQSPAFWRDLMRFGNQSISARAALASAAHLGDLGSNKGLADAMAGRQASNAPGWPIIAAFLGAYIVLLVPVSYLMLKKFDKRELAWFTAPGLVLGFTAIAYIIALSTKGAALTVNRVVVLETQANTDKVAGYGQLTVYSPRRASYDIAMAPAGEPGREYHAVAPAEIFDAGDGGTSDLTIEHDQTSLIKHAEIRLWDKRSFDTPVQTNLGGPLDISATWVDGNKVRFVITNRTKYTIHDCALINDGNDVVPVGDLAPGQSSGPKVAAWTYKDSSTAIHLPPMNANWQFSPNTLVHHNDTPDEVRNNLRFALTEAFKSANGFNGSPYMGNNMGYNEENTEVFGRSTNALTGWVDTGAAPLLNVQIDGKPAAGVEACLLFVHLPLAANMPEVMTSGVNPFGQDPILNLKDDAPKPGGGLIPR